MLRGDLSNEPSRRWLVTLESLLPDGEQIQKKRAFRRVGIPAVPAWSVGLAWQISVRNPSVMELVVFEQDARYCAELQDYLDRYYTHPFPYITNYPLWTDLQRSLVERPDVQYVVDDPANMLRWGSRGTTWKRLWEGR